MSLVPCSTKTASRRRKNVLYDDADDAKDTYESSRRHFTVISEHGEVLGPADEPVSAVEKAALLAVRKTHKGP